MELSASSKHKSAEERGSIFTFCVEKKRQLEFSMWGVIADEMRVLREENIVL